MDFGREGAALYDVLGGDYFSPVVTSLGAAGPQMCFEVVSH